MCRQYQIVPQLPAFYLFNKCTLGSVSLTTKDERYIIDDFAITRNNQIETPSHHFSEICKSVRFSKNNSAIEELTYPYKYVPCQVPYAFYIDISKAFSQIAAVVGMELSFREGRYIAFGTTVPEQLFSENKMMRALLVSGTGKLSTITTWNNHELTRRKFPNRNYAPLLRYAILKMLHVVQGLVSKFSIYGHTDGFIIPAWHFARVTRLLDERHILYSIKGEGITQVYGHGSYRIGNKHTKIYSGGQKQKIYIDDRFSEWWINNYTKAWELKQ